ncbi:carbohydrate ABC transporter permease [Actinomadura geliboluensis]|uniref:carbohydrate ABC transporter permease n=1 Tax=Actinomadura geliboluensis TaxID=882440 RepID=UPI0036C991BA
MAPPTSPRAEAAAPRAAPPRAASFGEDAAGLGRARAAAFTAPALVLVAVFLVFPALWTLYLGTTDYRLTGIAASDPRFVGADNYRDVLGDGEFHRSLWLTLQFVVGSAVIGQTLLGFAIAWVMRDRSGPVRRLVEGLVLLAWILPSSVIAFLWIALLDRDGGTLNALLGTPGTAWLLDHPMACIVVFNVWRGTAFSMMLYGAALGTFHRPIWRRPGSPGRPPGRRCGTRCSRASAGTC